VGPHGAAVGRQTVMMGRVRRAEPWAAPMCVATGRRRWRGGASAWAWRVGRPCGSVPCDAACMQHAQRVCMYMHSTACVRVCACACACARACVRVRLCASVRAAVHYVVGARCDGVARAW